MPAGVSLKIIQTNWKLNEVMLAAEYLDKTIYALTNDSIMLMLIGNDQSDEMLRSSNLESEENATKSVPSDSNRQPTSVRNGS